VPCGQSPDTTTPPHPPGTSSGWVPTRYYADDILGFSIRVDRRASGGKGGFASRFTAVAVAKSHTDRPPAPETTPASAQARRVRTRHVPHNTQLHASLLAHSPPVRNAPLRAFGARGFRGLFHRSLNNSGKSAAVRISSRRWGHRATACAYTRRYSHLWNGIANTFSMRRGHRNARP